MRNTARIFPLGLTPFLIILGVSCATSPSLLPPALELRTLRISPSLPGFEYRYSVCTNSLIGFCTKWEMKTETYDLRDEAVRKKLIDMGFVARVREMP